MQLEFVKDEWQKKILATEGNIICVGGRQIGKSEIFSIKEGDYVANKANSHLLIVSGVERQAAGLYDKILNYVLWKYPKKVKQGKDRPLKTLFKLTNGSMVRTVPLGIAGAGARQYTITRVVFEEMQLINRQAYAAITPMMLTTGGDIHMLGTMLGTDTYSYERLKDSTFKAFIIDAEDVAEHRPEPLRTIMLQWLKAEKSRMSAAEYMQEYKAIPTDKLKRVFSENIIEKCCVLERPERIDPQGVHYLGLDVGAMGEDPSAYEVLDMRDFKNIVHTESILTYKTFTTETSQNAINMHRNYKFIKMGIDDGGTGFGVYCDLIKEPTTKRITEALNNASRSTNYDGTKSKIIKKMEMYQNLVWLMETGRIKLLNDDDVKSSLRSCQYDYDLARKQIKVISKIGHIAEALMRASWYAQGKHLNFTISYF